ncbi:uncharacterized protein LOC114529452 [Dendronephthya gigantea]|uniref:uncharacterized protein LOC114529452 n=1 Tax=Dendronephthya gigantea TaxID=151771 RepID=UPI00106ADDA7|nr:uncharacterized protein LOC114529452 [Dendronephthya gigantea]
MSFNREYAHRPPIPTAEQIMEDFNLAKGREFTDPVFNLSKDEISIRGNDDKDDDKDLSPGTKQKKGEQLKEIDDTYNKVEEFLEQNKDLRKSIIKMNELSQELHAKKENLTLLISNISENMQEKEI